MPLSYKYRNLYVYNVYPIPGSMIKLRNKLYILSLININLIVCASPYNYVEGVFVYCYSIEIFKKFYMHGYFNINHGHFFIYLSGLEKIELLQMNKSEENSKLAVRIIDRYFS